MANLAAGIDADDTTVTLDAAIVVPSYRAGLTVGSETMRVLSWTSTTEAVVARGAGAAAHSLGAAVTAGYWSPAVAGGGTPGLLNNYAATAAPAVGDDSSGGYAVGSIWIDIAGDAAYICVDASSGAAVWIPFEAAGAGGAPAYGVDWMRFPTRVGAIGGPVAVAGHVSNGYNLSDNSHSTNANSTTANMPQDHRFGLGAPRWVSACYVVYSSSNNRSATGSLDYSDDGVVWTSAVTWSADATTERLHTFTPVAAAYWRIHTTVAGAAGSAGINIAQLRLINAGTDYAVGLTPTFNQSTSNATNATDRNVATNANQTNASMPQWCRVDLGTARTIHAVRAMFSGPGNAVGQAKVQYSTNDSTWTDVGTEQFLPQGQESRFDFDGTLARYWRMYVTSSIPGAVGINWAIFEVWGE